MRFTIRDLLWLTVVVALGVGWGLDHYIAWHKVEDQRSAMQKLLVESRLVMRESVESRDAARVRELDEENKALRRDIELFRKQLFGEK